MLRMRFQTVSLHNSLKKYVGINNRMNKCSALTGPHLMTRVSETGAGLGVKSTCKSWDACYLHGSWKRSSCKYHGSINPRFFPLCLRRLCNVQVCCVTNLANRNVCAENCFVFFVFFKWCSIVVDNLQLQFKKIDLCIRWKSKYICISFMAKTVLCEYVNQSVYIHT